MKETEKYFNKFKTTDMDLFSFLLEALSGNEYKAERLYLKIITNFKDQLEVTEQTKSLGSFDISLVYPIKNQTSH